MINRRVLRWHLAAMRRFAGRYGLNVLVALDQVLNTVLSGSPKETLSARCFRLKGRYRKFAMGRRLIDALFFFDAEHCEKAFWRDKDLLTADSLNLDLYDFQATGNLR